MIDHFTTLLMSHSIDIEFNRIKENKELSSNNIPYTTDYILRLIQYFELIEEYEKCQILLKYKNRKIEHDSRFCNL